MNYVIYGVGKIGKKAEIIIREKYGENISGYLDTYKSGEVNGYPIYDLDEVSKDMTIIIAILNWYYVVDICNNLRNKGFMKLFWFFDMHVKEKQDVGFLENECYKIPEWGEHLIPYVEFHISDKCNLNCKGCTHFSPLFDNIGASYDKRINDLREIKRLFPNLFVLNLLGGEPLLAPELDKYIIAVRKMFPESYIQITSNGLLIPKISKEVLQMIHDFNICISITEYLPTQKMMDRIMECLDRYKIKYRSLKYEKKQIFNRPISVNVHSKYKNLCISDGCIAVSDGKIARCPTLMFIYKFNEVFNENLPEEGIYFLDKVEDGEWLLSELKKEVPLCKHCVKNEMNWSLCGLERKFEDFAVRE